MCIEPFYIKLTLYDCYYNLQPLLLFLQVKYCLIHFCWELEYWNAGYVTCKHKSVSYTGSN